MLALQVGSYTIVKLFYQSILAWSIFLLASSPLSLQQKIGEMEGKRLRVRPHDIVFAQRSKIIAYLIRQPDVASAVIQQRTEDPQTAVSPFLGLISVVLVVDAG